ncbi:radical SAM protein [Nitrosophilus kaiyonis]|uniref:radical SAM protein n=1 Tax=Nitrosophilus kaiyonis TaxID=2930200 RepID=UPI0024907CF1|nr:radical SAM protein [Nitrosophilus kaiyonis]
MFDAIKLANETKNIVCKNLGRKYYRFRAAKFYGGIATADCVGCDLRCLFCWAWKEITNPKKYGRFYSPDEVVDKLLKIANRHGINKLRISGNEPTICKEHLIKVLELIPKDFLFILETNGILIGYDEKYAKSLSSFDNLHVRVSIKAATSKDFSKITGAKEDIFYYQLKALENLSKYNISFHPSIMVSFSEKKDIEKLKRRVEKISNSRYLEYESVILYPPVEKRLKKANLFPKY